MDKTLNLYEVQNLNEILMQGQRQGSGKGTAAPLSFSKRRKKKEAKKRKKSRKKRGKIKKIKKMIKNDQNPVYK